VRVAALPEAGEANEELVRVLALFLGIPRGSIEIRRGGAGRTKDLALRGVDPAALAARLGAARGDDPGRRGGPDRRTEKR
jgi:uncharacterized protein YggU (UPF0235/DUF167 family)